MISPRRTRRTKLFPTVVAGAATAAFRQKCAAAHLWRREQCFVGPASFGPKSQSVKKNEVSVSNTRHSNQLKNVTTERQNCPQGTELRCS